MQLEWAHQVVKYTNKPVLILAPLAVVEQTKQQAIDFNIDTTNILFENYEQLKKIDCRNLAGIVLDESSILKNFSGSTRNLIVEKFKNTPYKLACTATPSPNDIFELGSTSEFLDVLKHYQVFWVLK